MSQAAIAVASLGVLGIGVLSAGAVQASAQRVTHVLHPTAPAKAEDWFHDLQVIANLRADPPDAPVVLLLGGSTVRESTISDESWTAEVYAQGMNALTYNLGSSRRTFAESLAFVRALPRWGLEGVAFIGVNPGNFTTSQRRASISLPAPTNALPPWTQHVESERRARPAGERRDIVRRWSRERRPLFQAYYGIQRVLLDRLIAACKSRRLRPVLVEMPLDTEVIRHALDAETSRIRRTCRALSAKHSVPFLDGGAAPTDLGSADFADLWHLVEPGRVKWQAFLARETVRQLGAYGLGLAAGEAAPNEVTQRFAVFAARGAGSADATVRYAAPHPAPPPATRTRAPAILRGAPSGSAEAPRRR